MIDCHVILFDCAQPRPVDGSYCIKGSVFSEAFLRLGHALVTIVMDFSGIARSVFLDLTVDNFPVLASLRGSNFASSSGSENEAAIMLRRQ